MEEQLRTTLEAAQFEELVVRLGNGYYQFGSHHRACIRLKGDGRVYASLNEASYEPFEDFIRRLIPEVSGDGAKAKALEVSDPVEAQAKEIGASMLDQGKPGTNSRASSTVGNSGAPSVGGTSAIAAGASAGTIAGIASAGSAVSSTSDTVRAGGGGSGRQSVGGHGVERRTGQTTERRTIDQGLTPPRVRQGAAQQPGTASERHERSPRTPVALNQPPAQTAGNLAASAVASGGPPVNPPSSVATGGVVAPAVGVARTPRAWSPGPVVGAANPVAQAATNNRLRSPRVIRPHAPGDDLVGRAGGGGGSMRLSCGDTQGRELPISPPPSGHSLAPRQRSRPAGVAAAGMAPPGPMVVGAHCGGGPGSFGSLTGGTAGSGGSAPCVQNAVAAAAIRRSPPRRSPSPEQGTGSRGSLAPGGGHGGSGALIVNSGSGNFGSANYGSGNYGSGNYGSGSYPASGGSGSYAPSDVKSPCRGCYTGGVPGRTSPPRAGTPRAGPLWRQPTNVPQTAILGQHPSPVPYVGNQPVSARTTGIVGGVHGTVMANMIPPGAMNSGPLISAVSNPNTQWPSPQRTAARSPSIPQRPGQNQQTGQLVPQPGQQQAMIGSSAWQHPMAAPVCTRMGAIRSTSASPVRHVADPGSMGQVGRPLR
eukprot:TRINITY_DN35167_c0_g2_i1.p1 TRINITY_DN35167_c0_g2~~TRINITY_DN35167_c0_g2_i1.p1  ORF type:complete len:726 (+),score=123.09 TRINITY_DN35167_c0_g2_i1:229-2178(+)